MNTLNFFWLFILTWPYLCYSTTDPLPSYLTQTFIASVEDTSQSIYPAVSVVDDHIYTVGDIAGSYMGLPFNGTSYAEGDIAFFQLRRDGVRTWVNSVGSAQLEQSYYMISAGSYLYIIGQTSSVTTFNGIQVNGSGDVFVIKVSQSNGSIVATAVLGSPNVDGPGRLAYCSYDNTILVTWSRDYGGTTIITKMNTNLGIIWSTDTGVAGTLSGFGSSGGVTCDNVTGQIYASGGNDITYFRLLSNGSIVLSKSVAATGGDDKGYELARVGGNIYIVGSVEGDYGTYTFQGGSGDPIILKVNETTGNVLGYVIMNATSGDDHNRHIVVDFDGNLIVYGTTGDTLYLTKFDQNLGVVWHTPFQGTFIGGICMDPLDPSQFFVGAAMVGNWYSLSSSQFADGVIGIVESSNSSSPSSSPIPPSTSPVAASNSPVPTTPSSSPKADNGNRGHGGKAGMIAGVVVGITAGAGLVVGAFIVYKRRRNTEERSDPAPSTKKNEELQNVTIGLEKEEHEEKANSEFEYLNDIEIKEVIGSGSFGDVYRGVWKGTQLVALKKLKVDKMQEFLQEASMLQKCSFPNVVTFFGLHRDQNKDIYMVTEFMSGGALNNLLQEEGESLPTKTLVEMAQDAVCGIRSMANKGLVHRDLAARNLLVHKEDGKYLAKVADFGLARHLSGNYYTSSKSMFPIKWSAPEVLKYEKFSVKSDVWSFGIVLWEIFEQGSMPYRGMGNNEAAEAVLAGYRLPKPQSCPDSVYTLMTSCWSTDASKRPTFDEIYSTLQVILKTEDFAATPTNNTLYPEKTFYANKSV